MSKNKRRAQSPVEQPISAANNPSANSTSSTAPFAWIGIVLLVIALIVRLRLLDIPFERDEGVFAYIGRAMMGGARLYTDLYDNKLPGLYLIYGLFASLFGVQPTGIHLGALLWQLATISVLFLWLREVIGRDRALASTGLFALYAASGQVLGFAAHATQLCALPAFAGLWALWRGTGQGRSPQAAWIILAGLGAGLAIWIKQQALFYAVFGALYLAWWFFGRGRSESIMRALGLGMLYALGVILPVGLSAAWFASQGRFDDFWFWTVDISTGATFKTQAPGGWVFFNFYFPKVIAHWWWVWFVGLFGMIVMLRQKQAVEQRALAGLLPLSLWGVSLGGAFYPHYFVLALPWLAICAILGLETLVRKYGRPGWIVASVVLIWPILAHNGYWFREDDRTILRRAYDNNPFHEMAQIGAELKKRSAPTDSIAVIGSEPELFLYADRPSALSHLFFQGVVQHHARYAQFQQQIREELWGRRPRFVVFPGAQYEHLKDDPLVKEIVDRLQKEYHTIGVVDIQEKKSTITWDPPPEKAVPQTLFWVIIMERN
ncbi:MAG: glycosyltransferase family 39 protein [Saprospiraceae bacterium]|nr:glycosyltransferase family 39 protein [Saprospiraceae bacterium]